MNLRIQTRFFWRLVRAAAACFLSVLPLAGVSAQTLVSARVGTGTALAERVAIVIGNQDYTNVADLGNARKDAQDMAAMLREFQFNVFDGYDLDKRQFEELLRTAMLNIPAGADVVFYYAGHGIQLGRRNYLLPVDATFSSIYDVPIETMTLDGVIDTLAARGSAHVAILDSCRNNPFPNIRLAADLDANLFETKSGFEVFKTPLNSLVAFSTSPGAIASDGMAGGNSPYTSAVLNTARATPTANIQQIFPVVREQVHTVTAGAQVPWESSTLVRPFVLAPGAGAKEALITSTEEPGEEQGGEIVLGQVRSNAPPSQEVSVNLNVRFDRRVSLDGFLATRIDAVLTNPILAQAPQNGILTLSDNSIVYSPEISDVRSTQLEDLILTDSFTIEAVGADNLPQRVKVGLNLLVDGCDLASGDALDLNGIGVYRLPNELDILSGLEACEASVRSDPENPRFHYQLGRLQQSAGRFEDAYRSFGIAEQGGHTRAKYALAVLLSTDQLDRDVYDIPENLDRARTLLEEGVAERDAYAMHRLGKDLLRRGQTDAERKQGFELLERSVELGHTYSMNELGLYFLRKDTDHYIPERGMRYLTASRQREDIYGYDNLGHVALNGLDGNPADFSLAQEYFRTASEGGHPQSPSMIARMILRGQLGDADPAEAIRWYDKSLERGDGWGGANAAAVILKGSVPGLGDADAAVRAAKATHLRNVKAAEAAGKRLATIPRPALDRALQMVLNEVGAGIAVDGQVGGQTIASLKQVSSAAGVPYQASDDPLSRLLLATRVYWAQNPVRFDLF